MNKIIAANVVGDFVIHVGEVDLGCVLDKHSLIDIDFMHPKPKIGDHISLFTISEGIRDAAGIERQWRNSELSRTDPLALLPDYPRDGTDLLAYRQALADYPASEGFPNGVRPKPEDFLVTS